MRRGCGRTAEEALSEGCKKGATVDRRGGLGIDGWASRRTSPGPPRAAPGPVPPAPRGPEAWGATPLAPSAYCRRCQQRRNRRHRAKGIRPKCRATECKNDDASAHRCDDEGKEDHRRNDQRRTSGSCATVTVTERGGAVSGR